jgi:lysophospholipase L1-like esterase
LDLIRYSDDVIIKYHPEQIVIYCGENDFASSDTVTVEMLLSRFKQLFSIIRSQYKKIPVAYISMKPSPSRQHLMPEFAEANERIKKYLKRKRKAVFIDVYHSMLEADGTPIKGIFVEDNLHMNADGYAIWQKIIEPYLLK